MGDDSEATSLTGLLQEAEARRQASEAADVEAALALYARLLDRSAAAGLFSANETADDLPTSSLPFLLVEYHLAELLQRTGFATPAARRLTLGRARDAYLGFLRLVDAYRLLERPYVELLERCRLDPDAFSLVAPGTDAAATREAKIAHSRTLRALEQKRNLLARDPGYVQRTDDDVVRQLHLAAVAHAVHSSFQALDSLNRELAVLAEAPPDGFSARSQSSPDDADTRLDGASLPSRPPGGPLLSRQGKPLQPFTLVNTRADRAKAVFRPGHSLPTMSIDEYLAEERRQGNILEGGTDRPPVPAVDDDDAEAVDRETYKARQWDDFKDENPRGAGNTLNMG